MRAIYRLTKEEIQSKLHDVAIEVIDTSNQYVTTRTIKSTFYKNIRFDKRCDRGPGAASFQRKVNANLKVVMITLTEIGKVISLKKGTYKIINKKQL